MQCAFVKTDDAIRSIKKKIVKKMFEKKKKRMDIRDRDIKSRYLLIIYRGMLQVGFSIQAK